MADELLFPSSHTPKQKRQLRVEVILFPLSECKRGATRRRHAGIARSMATANFICCLFCFSWQKRQREKRTRGERERMCASEQNKHTVQQKNPSRWSFVSIANVLLGGFSCSIYRKKEKIISNKKEEEEETDHADQDSIGLRRWSSCDVRILLASAWICVNKCVWVWMKWNVLV